MPIDTKPASQRIEAGRSWRDLPPAPPTTAPDRPQPATPSIIAPVDRSWPWARISAGILALAVGIAVGVWAPWSQPAAGDPLPLAADELPETIVPDAPPELTDPQPSQDPFAGLPEDLPAPEQFFDQLPQDFLDQLPPGFFEGLPDGLGGPPIETAGLIDFAGLPDGYQARSNVFSRSNDTASQRIRLLGPDGPVDVQAIQGPEVALPGSGEPFTVAGADGRLEMSGATTTISWLAEPDLLITVEASSDVETDVLTTIAEAVEVTQ
jgi:hypothetical protein